MNKLLLLLLVTTPTFANNKAIYGDDSRIEVSQSKNSLHQILAKSVAAMVAKKKMKNLGNGTNTLPNDTLRDILSVCSSTRFAKQQSASDCTGFLVAPNLLATAGHCIDEDLCQDSNWVFDYKLDNGNQTHVKSVKSSNVYSCKRVVNYEFGRFSTIDWALIELDRPVKDRVPLKLSTKAPKVSDPLFVIGTPSGLPLKVATGKVRKVNEENFVTNLDTFGGNSGSPIFNAKTGLVEGILVRGDVDYKYTWLGFGCGKTNEYTENAGAGEYATHISHVRKELK